MNYSIFIKGIKYFFLLISIIIITLVFYNNNSFKKEKMTTKNIFYQEGFKSVTQVLRKPKFMGIDKKKQPFKVMAEKAIRYKSTPDIFNLEMPTGEINSGKEKFFLRGDSGEFNKEIQQLKVEGNVKLNDSNNMTFNTSKMYFDFKKEIVSGDEKIEGEKNNSLIVSEGFKIFNKGQKIIFTGKSKLTVDNN